MYRITNNIHLLEWIGLNLLNIGVLTWINYIPTLITSFVGLSIIVLNMIKIYKELKK
jgi:hypothetical protein